MKSLAKEEPNAEEELFHQLFSENTALEGIPVCNLQENTTVQYNYHQQFPQPLPVAEHLCDQPQESNTSSCSMMSFGQTNSPMNAQIYLPSPIMVLNLASHTGDHEFTVKVPRVYGKNKWTFCSKLSKLYAGRNVPFPVKITFPAGRTLSVVISPVFEETSWRFAPVRRCLNCSMSDKSPMQEHLLRVDGTDCSYLMENDRCVVEVPLHNQTLDENAMTVLLRMTCRTSCLGGPNRHLFALLFTLLDENRQQIASDVQHVKCCESPFRDMKNEVAHAAKLQTTIAQPANQDSQQIAHIASSLDSKRSVKRKLETKSEESYDILKIPKQYTKRVRTYVNLLYCREKNEKHMRYFSTDTE